jgi:lipopolysaccharide/colanic/teichoic acid biosynthesis glycosyltransferase
MSTSITRVAPPDPHDFHQRDFDKDMDGGEGEEEREEISAVEQVLRTAIDAVLHYLPQIVILLLCIPVLVVVSLVAGLVVRNSVPQPWERRVFLQYGCVA